MVRISAIVPVYLEQERINDFLRSTLDVFDMTRDEIIVVDGDPQSSTLKAIRTSGIRTITSEKGRGAQMNAGAEAARGRILVFVHADTLLPPNAAVLIHQALQKKDAAAGAFSLGIVSSRLSLRIVALMANLRSGWTGVPYGDQAVFVRGDLFHKLGGFRNIPIMEDLEFMHRIKNMGHRIEILPQKAWTSSRRWDKEGVFRGTLRNWLIRSFYHLGVSPERLKKFY